MVRFGFEQTGNIGLLTFTGELTQQHSSEMKTALMRALHRVDHLIFSLEKVTSIDVACFQLLCAAQRISMCLNKRVTITGFRHKSFTRLFEDERLNPKECLLDCLKAVCRWRDGERTRRRNAAKKENRARAEESSHLTTCRGGGAEQ